MARVLSILAERIEEGDLLLDSRLPNNPVTEVVLFPREGVVQLDSPMGMEVLPYGEVVRVIR